MACAACHAREGFQTVYNEQGETILDKNASDYEMEWSNCTNCHVGDPGEGKVEGGNAYGDATSVSAKALFPEEDYVCGQGHAMCPGAAYLEDANKGIDQYKYGFEPEEMLRAMKEYYEANPVTETTICAGMVGVPMLDPEIDTMILGCTHYPILLPKIQKYTPKHIRIVAQGEYVAESLKDYLSRHPEMNAKCTQNGSCLFYTTEAEEKFVESASSFLNQQIDVKRISLE